MKIKNSQLKMEDSLPKSQEVYSGVPEGMTVKDTL